MGWQAHVKKSSRVKTQQYAVTAVSVKTCTTLCWRGSKAQAHAWYIEPMPAMAGSSGIPAPHRQAVGGVHVLRAMCYINAKPKRHMQYMMLLASPGSCEKVSCIVVPPAGHDQGNTRPRTKQNKVGHLAADRAAMLPRLLPIGDI